MTLREFFSTRDRIETLIIGGTGTLGLALIEILYPDPKYSITVLSREELKQKQLLKRFPKVKCVLGDIRDIESLNPHTLGKDLVFHLAAMKHVDMAELNLDENLKINLLGSLNVAKSCLAGNVGAVVLSSTDKAVLPINGYGYCKAFAEKYFLDLNRTQKNTRFSVFRWGNVIGSRGSVVHDFAESLRTKKTVSITDVRMSRFWINIDEAAKFMLEYYDSAPLDGVAIPPMKSAKIIDLAHACAIYLGISDYKTKITGIRPGEKIHECLFSSHDNCLRSDTCLEYTQDELIDMISRILK